MTQRILGIDPGLHGGYAVVTSTGKLVEAGHTPVIELKKKLHIDATALAATIQRLKPDHAFVEAVSSRPRQAGQFQFGINTGMVHGILHATKVPFDLIAPASWKAAFGIKRGEDRTKADTKGEARAKAAHWFPDHAHLFRRVRDDGVAEATLIAFYGIYILAQR